MELQLGLALPSNPVRGFDLNCQVHETMGALGSDPWSHDPCLSRQNTINKKRSFDEAFEFEQSIAVPQTLPLLLWNNQPNGEDDPAGVENEKNSFTVNKNEGDFVFVGWPPIKSWRKKLCGQNHGGRAANLYRTAENGCGGGGSSSMYVKVKMEGVGITRKVDLSLHHSYQTLTSTLFGMFGKCQKDVKDYKFTYQDREGDWLLAGDVPWQTFIRSVQRLKLLRRNNG